jgi:hypothetical protein
MTTNFRVFFDEALHEVATGVTANHIGVASHEGSLGSRLITAPPGREKDNGREQIVSA